jgi:predicted  nucleic acid-binding Zn-ribbon protein
VEAERAEIPHRRGEHEARLAEERSRLDAARSALEACQKSRRQHEAALQDLEAKRSKYKGQLMEVKTNKEYTAMLHEIEAVEREIRGREDQILADMERAEGLAAEVKREEERYRAAEEEARREGRTLDERGRVLAEEGGRLAAERDQIAARIPESLLDLFQRVARLRGVAVAEARDGMCQLCHVRLRPQMYVDLKRNEDVLQCPACSRILYFEAVVPAATPEP